MKYPPKLIQKSTIMFPEISKTNGSFPDSPHLTAGKVYPVPELNFRINCNNYTTKSSNIMVISHTGQIGTSLAIAAPCTYPVITTRTTTATQDT